VKTPIGLWKAHRGTLLNDTRHRKHCLEAGYEAGYSQGVEDAVTACRNALFGGDDYVCYSLGDMRAEATAAIRRLIEEEKLT
jgi:hypothetical protein